MTVLVGIVFCCYQNFMLLFTRTDCIEKIIKMPSYIFVRLHLQNLIKKRDFVDQFLFLLANQFSAKLTFE